MMRQGVLPLNAFLSFFYIIISAIVLFLLKRAVKPRLHLSKASKSQLLSSTKSIINYDTIVLLSWFKKYTLIGSCFMKDKKFLLKEFAFISAYAVTCLNINHLIIWPLGLSAAIVVLSFLFLQLIVFKCEEQLIEEKMTNKVKTANHQPQSQLEIESVDIQNIKTKVKTQEQVKLGSKTLRSLVQLLMITSFCFASLTMLLQTAMNLGNSLSNSGQLNILSVLLIFAIDQIAFRPLVGGLIWLTYKVFIKLTETKPEQIQLVQYLCSQEVSCMLVEKQKQRLKKLAEMTASPPKKRNESPSKVPKALGLSHDAPTYLNLISFQPTKRQNEVQDEQIENIYLTTAEKQLFEGMNTQENKSGMHTCRKENKQNHENSRSGAHKGTTIDVNQYHDLILIKDQPLHQIQDNHVDQFYLEEDYSATKRKYGNRKKKNKRNLQLTGNSPYLQYLPDMLKKVDKYKHDHPKKENEENKKSRKLL